MKKNKLFLSLSGLLLLTLIISSLSVNVKGANTLDYTFEKDLLYNNTNIQVLNETFNLRNQTQYTSHYPATYSFTNNYDQVIDGWTIDDGTNCKTSILENLDGHDKVLNLTDNSITSLARIKQNFNSSQVAGSIEFYMRTDNITQASIISLFGSGEEKIRIGFRSSQIQYLETAWTVLLYTALNDLWYHIRIEFNCTTDKMNIFLNGKKEADNDDFFNVATNLDEIIIETFEGGLGNSLYIDAIGYSWDKTNYTNDWFDLSGECTEPTSITWDGTHYWIVDLITAEVYQYTEEGIYTSEHFDVSGQDIYPQGITWDGTYYWIVGSNTDEVYQYTNTGVYTGFHFDVSGQDIHPVGIIWNNNSFWIVGKIQDKVYQYNSSGVYTGFFFSVLSQDNNPSDIAFDGKYLWILGYQNQEVFRYTTTGIYTGVHFDVITEDYASEGLLYKKGSFWTTGLQYIKAYRYRYVEFPYSIGDNMIPIIEIDTSILEVDKYEFALEGINNFYDTEDQNPSTWDTTTQGTAISQIGDGAEPTKDKIVYMFGSGVGNNFGIEKTDFSYTENFIDVNFGLMFIDWSGTTSYFMIVIHSSDGTEIIALAFYTDGRFAYIDDGVQIFRDDIDIMINYDIGIHIDYSTDICFIYYTVEGVLIETYIINLLETGKIGLKEIDMNSILVSTNFMIVGLDYVGVYANGLSNAGEGEYGYLSIDLESPTINWNFQHHSYFTIIANGEFAIYSSEGTYSIGESIGLVFEELQYNNTKIMFNIYERGFTDLNNPFLIVYLSNNFFNNITYLNIEGIKLSEGLNNYFPSHAYNGINVNKSYFWVDSNNRLQFTLTINDDNLEYIQLSFNVNDVPSEDRTISFISNINGDSKGYLSLDYSDDTINLLEFPYYQTKTQVILPQTKTIESFTILITDSDLDNNDLCTGYIENIKLLYNPDLELTILTDTIIRMIIPLIVMLLPSIIMAKKFGIVGVIVMFILMSLICVIANLIPVWLFFIIAFSSITFLIIKREGAK